MRIHIIGCSGSGKTYLAKKLSNKYHVPHFDLDDIQWENSSDSYGVKRPLEEKIEMLQKVCIYKEWIIEESTTRGYNRVLKKQIRFMC